MALLEEGEEENQIPPSVVETAFHGHGNDADAIKSTLFHERWVKAYPSAPSTLVVGPNFDSTNSKQRDARGFTEIHDFDTPMSDVSLDTHIGSSICVARIMEEPLTRPQPLTAKQRQLIGSFIRSEVPRAVQPRYACRCAFCLFHTLTPTPPHANPNPSPTAASTASEKGFPGSIAATGRLACLAVAIMWVCTTAWWPPTSLCATWSSSPAFPRRLPTCTTLSAARISGWWEWAGVWVDQLFTPSHPSFGQVVSHPAYQATLDLASRQSRRLAYQVASAIGATIR